MDAMEEVGDLQRCGRITGLLRSCVSDFSRVGSLYGALFESSFDADILKNIEYKPGFPS